MVRGANYFPVNFEGAGVTAEYTWFDRYYMAQTFYDGTHKSDGKDRPSVVRFRAQYALSDTGDIGLEFIQATTAVSKLRGEVLVRF
ncbi:MAG TPA: hypothetical protein VEI97_17635 [bacterium]|nr:hypothetical protein [bacterium]